MGVEVGQQVIGAVGIKVMEAARVGPQKLAAPKLKEALLTISISAQIPAHSGVSEKVG